MINYFEQNYNDIKQHAKDEYPNECVGVIYQNTYFRLSNIAEDKTNNFVVDPHEWIQYNGVQCLIHSHNDYPHASSMDQEQQLRLDIPFGIVNVVNRSVTDIFFWGDTLEPQHLLERKFYQGVYDCYSLVRDYYRSNGLTLPYGKRDYGFWDIGQDIIMENIYRIPFKEVGLNEADKYDLLLYSISGKKIDHCAVLLDNGWVLHHLVGQLSGLKPVSYLHECIVKVYRYKGDTNDWKYNTTRSIR